MKCDSMTASKEFSLDDHIKAAWDQIAPCWPQKNIISVNPLRGLEDLPFDEAINMGNKLFQSNNFSIEMDTVNRETIKWCQAYFDEGQATIQMPLRHMGFYQSLKKLIIFDRKIHVEKKKFISQIPNDPLDAICILLKKLKINLSDTSLFLKHLLTTLPGWAGYIKYKSEWDYADEAHNFNTLEYQYIAIRLILIFLFCTNRFELSQLCKNEKMKIDINAIKNYENKYHHNLLNKLQKKFIKPNEKVKNKKPKAQFIFCIDVRSEPFRKAIESEGDYETFGFAGFFGIPLQVQLSDLEKYASCPVLLKPEHTINEDFDYNCCKNFKKTISRNENIKLTKKIYQSLKYNFTTPFLLAELLGFWSGLWMMLKTFFPIISSDTKKNILEKTGSTAKISPTINENGLLEGIPFSHQINYAENMLRMIDLVKDFSPLILLCGHGSSTVNNAYSSSLDCGACGGHDGAPNARVMAAILNSDAVRNELKKRGIEIPIDSKFVAALHNTTTDDVTLFSSENYSA